MSTQPTQTTGRTDDEPTISGRPKSHQEMTNDELTAAFDRAESFREQCLANDDARGVELQNEYLALLLLEAETREDFDAEAHR